MASISIKFPFERTQQGGVFATNQTTEEKIRTNLVSLLTTKRGHRVMRPEFFSPIFDFMFDPFTEAERDELEEEIIHKVSKFIPEVNIRHVDAQISDDNTIQIDIGYSIRELGGARDNVTIFVPVDLEQYE